MNWYFTPLFNDFLALGKDLSLFNQSVDWILLFGWLARLSLSFLNMVLCFPLPLAPTFQGSRKGWSIAIPLGYRNAPWFSLILYWRNTKVSWNPIPAAKFPDISLLSVLAKVWLFRVSLNLISSSPFFQYSRFHLSWAKELQKITQ